MPRYYVFAITHSDMCCWTHRPLRAKSPQHAEAKFLGKMGVKKNARNFAENVCRWGDREKSGRTNLLYPKPYSDAWEAKMQRGLTSL